MVANLVAFLLTAAGSVAWLKCCETLADYDYLSSSVCRKFVHIGTGLIFMLFWPIFDDNEHACYWAAAIPGLITIRFFLIGMGVLKDEKTVKSMSRSGKASELLYGPLAYGIIFVLSTAVYWRTSPVGIAALTLLCVGDGFATLVGQHFNGPKLPHNPNKSVIGSLSFLVSSILAGYFYLQLFIPFYTHSVAHLTRNLVIISLVAAGVESLPLGAWDNFAVFGTCIAISKLLGW
eukprot:TRINITY_DN12860_c0_g1_i1.p1 TRINITY_DN12860_c0_g1~~TRINITY_DN12860_c0_g1_i1.p1  ORF type:complete len:234 (+),score=33.36 TRINITY_DN12860_c0_g1_i1:37-738(+)